MRAQFRLLFGTLVRSIDGFAMAPLVDCLGLKAAAKHFNIYTRSLLAKMTRIGLLKCLSNRWDSSNMAMKMTPRTRHRHGIPASKGQIQTPIRGNLKPVLPYFMHKILERLANLEQA